MQNSADVVVIGAGIIGMSTAFQIARRSKLRVVVLEKGRGPGEGSTGASSAVCRFRYSCREIVQLARDGIGAYQQWPAFLGNDAPFASYQRIGALWLSQAPDWAMREAERLTGLGLRTVALDDADLAEAFPDIRPCIVPPDLVGGEEHNCRGGGRHLFEMDGGYMDPVDALQDLILSSRGRGVDLHFNSAVASVELEGASVARVRLADGSEIACGAVVLAAGPWCSVILDQLGLGARWPLEPTRIQMIHVDRPASVAGELPVVIDVPSGTYFRPQNRGQQIILGSVDEEDEREAVSDPDAFARYADDDFIRAKLHALQHRLGLETIGGRISSYSGLYTINRADMHPIVGETPVPGFFVANGCSGHGFKLAPAIGALLARRITGESDDFDTAMDPAFLAYDRKPISLSAMNVLA
jgi:glycine/D-amino acid oxidase-like deaminating enzyme